ncbi:MAG: CpaF family protein [Thermovenabulum sp.]|uniref:CpaF family protein n=1 Tax=Thermovenabulum sp. TaxID=3100335 RepID=UPI003C79C2EF
MKNLKYYIGETQEEKFDINKIMHKKACYYEDGLEDRLYEQIETEVIEMLTNYIGTNKEVEMHHETMIEASLGSEDAEKIIKNKIKDIISKKHRTLPIDRIEKYTKKIYEENYGYGPIHDLIKNPEINEIWVNGASHIYIEKMGKKYRVNKCFKSDEDVIRVIRLLLAQDKIDINAQQPMHEAKLKDGTRITALIPPVAKKPYINIRKFKAFSPTTDNLIKAGTLTEEMVEWLSKIVKGRANILIIGEAGAGKTSLLKWLINFVNPELRIGTLETDFELNLEEIYPERNIFSYEEHIELNITLNDLFRKCLRSSPDIIIVGEARGVEADEMIRAMRRGHPGSMSTIHTNSPETAIDDIAEMINEDGKRRDPVQLRFRVASAIDVIIQIHRMHDGVRRVTRITEVISDFKTQEYRFNDIFLYKIDPEKPYIGQFEKVGNISDKLRNKLNFYGLSIQELEGL